ncbi:phospholipase D1-like [Artemia franciscana]|uniref:phospholipase D1-like n=1 Tax=Artemia franciscana TaxID=6661 RepID=UPI0032D9C7D9
MIVDDNTVICGSANINDRSLIGKRDSEIAVIFQDLDFEPSLMDGKPYDCGRFAGSLRKYLFREHLGLLGQADPVCDAFYKGVWIKAASLNTKIYEEVFNCLPADRVTTFSEVKLYQSLVALSIRNPEEAEEKLKQVKGNLVLLPLNFLCN